MKKKLIAFLGFVVLFMSMKATIYDLRTMQPCGKHVSTQPKISVEETDSATIIGFTSNYVSINQNLIKESVFSFEGFNMSSCPGSPLVPVKHFNAMLKCGSKYEMRIIDVNYVELNARLPFVSEHRPESHLGHELISDIDSDINTENNCKSVIGSYVESGNVQVYRGINHVPVSIFPVQYDSEKGVVRVLRSLNFEIINKDDDHKIEIEPQVKYTISPNDVIFNSFINKPSVHSKVNASDTDDFGTLEPNPTSPGYLILTVNDLKDAADELAKWKTYLGYNVKIYSRNQIGSNIWTPDNIKSRIKLYLQSNPDLYYVLILGDHLHVPAEIFPHPSASYDPDVQDYASDFQYSCLDGDLDETPDVHIGRIPACNLEEAMNAVEKIISFEKNPVTEPSFYKRAFHISEFTSKPDMKTELGIHVYTINQLSNAMATNCGLAIDKIYSAKDNVEPMKWDPNYVNYKIEFPDYLKRSNFAWNGTKNDINQSFNKGCVYGVYRGHGGYEQWGNILKYKSADVAGLSNKNKYPVVFAITCESGAFNKTNKSLAKEFLTAKESGVSGIVAATETSFTGFNEVLLVGLLDGLYPSSKLQLTFNDPEISVYPSDKAYQDTNNLLATSTSEIYKIGDLLDNSKMIMSTFYSSEKSDIYRLTTKRLFHVLGDPSMNIATSVPIDILSTGLKITKTSDSYVVTGYDRDKFKYGALITVVDTISNKIVAIEALKNTTITYGNIGRCKLCISGHNMRPLITDKSTVAIRGVAAKKENYIEYLDFTTNQRRVVNEEIEQPNAYNIDQLGDGIIDIKTNGVYIQHFASYPEGEVWSPILRAACQPQRNVSVCSLKFQSLSSTEPDIKDFHILSAEYIEFPNVIHLGESYLYADMADIPNGDRLWFKEIQPYSGYYPDHIIRECSINYWLDGKKHLYLTELELDPYSYNFEDKTMRVYTHIRIKHDYPAKNDSIRIESENIEYFRIDGMIELNPQKGNLYIQKKGNSFEKIIY